MPRKQARYSCKFGGKKMRVSCLEEMQVEKVNKQNGVGLRRITGDQQR